MSALPTYWSVSELHSKYLDSFRLQCRMTSRRNVKIVTFIYCEIQNAGAYCKCVCAMLGHWTIVLDGWIVHNFGNNRHAKFLLARMLPIEGSEGGKKARLIRPPCGSDSWEV